MNLYYVKFIVDIHSRYVIAKDFAEAENKALNNVKDKLILSIEAKQWNI